MCIIKAMIPFPGKIFGEYLSPHHKKEKAHKGRTVVFKGDIVQFVTVIFVSFRIRYF